MSFEYMNLKTRLASPKKVRKRQLGVRRHVPVGYIMNTEMSFLLLKPYIAAEPVSP